MNFAIAKVTSLSDSSSDSELNSSSSSSESNSSSSEASSSDSDSSSSDSESSCCDSNCSCSSSDSSSESSSDSEEEPIHLNKEKKLYISNKEVSKFTKVECKGHATALEDAMNNNEKVTQFIIEENKDHTTIEKKSYKIIGIKDWLRKRRDAKRERDESERKEIELEKVRYQALKGYRKFQRESINMEDKHEKPGYTQPRIKLEVPKQISINNNQENVIRKNDVKESEKPVSKADLSKIILSRDKVESFVQNSSFDKIVQGCYVRVGMITGADRGYVLSQIIGVRKTANFYRLGNTTTNKGLLLRAGKDVIPLQFISNQEITDREFTKWQAECAHKGTPMPTLDGIARKLKNIKEVEERTATAITKTTTTEKGQEVHNIAKRKIQLRFQRDEATWRGDHQTAKKLDLQMKELEKESLSKMEPEKKRPRFSSNINENVYNFDVSYGDDPFQRKSTRPKLFSRKDRL